MSFQGRSEVVPVFRFGELVLQAIDPLLEGFGGFPDPALEVQAFHDLIKLGVCAGVIGGEAGLRLVYGGFEDDPTARRR